MRPKRFRRPSMEERIRRDFMRRRRRADQNARRRAAKLTKELTDVNRWELLEAAEHTCYLCGHFLSVHDMTLDHVVPLARGGAHTPENLRPAHRSCNSRKGSRLLSETKPS
jgi:5-methylcytosine-specific restriction endonuclease McrA